MGISLTANIGEMALTSNGLIDAVRTGSPGKMLDAVGYPTIVNGATQCVPYLCPPTHSVAVRVGRLVLFGRAWCLRA